MQNLLELLHSLLCRPALTLALGATYRPHLLRLISALVTRHLDAVASNSEFNDAPLSVALLRLLPLAPHIQPCVTAACSFLYTIFMLRVLSPVLIAAGACWLS